MKAKKKLIITKTGIRGSTVHVSLGLDQKGFEVGVYSGRRAYLWMGPSEGPGQVLTLDVSDMKRVLRAAGHLT